MAESGSGMDLAALRKQVEAARDDLIAEGRHKSVDWLPYLPINGVLSLLDRIEELERQFDHYREHHP